MAEHGEGPGGGDEANASLAGMTLGQLEGLVRRVVSEEVQRQVQLLQQQQQQAPPPIKAEEVGGVRAALVSAAVAPRIATGPGVPVTRRQTGFVAISLSQTSPANPVVSIRQLNATQLRDAKQTLNVHLGALLGAAWEMRPVVMRNLLMGTRAREAGHFAQFWIRAAWQFTSVCSCAEHGQHLFGASTTEMSAMLAQRKNKLMEAARARADTLAVLIAGGWHFYQNSIARLKRRQLVSHAGRIVVPNDTVTATLESFLMEHPSIQEALQPPFPPPQPPQLPPGSVSLGIDGGVSSASTAAAVSVSEPVHDAGAAGAAELGEHRGLGDGEEAQQPDALQQSDAHQGSDGDADDTGAAMREVLQHAEPARNNKRRRTVTAAATYR